MHVILVMEANVRTTIELRDDHRARLLEIAARRGEKGFSSLVAEAVETYLEAQRQLDEARRLALDARGTLREREVEDLRKETTHLRTDWR